MRTFDVNCNDSSSSDGGSGEDTAASSDFPNEYERHTEMMTVLNGIYIQLNKLNKHFDIFHTPLDL